MTADREDIGSMSDSGVRLCWRQTYLVPTATKAFRALTRCCSLQKADLRRLAESVYPLVDQRIEVELPHGIAYQEAESLRAKLAAASPQYAAMLAGWEDTEVTPEL